MLWTENPSENAPINVNCVVIGSISASTSNLATASDLATVATYTNSTISDTSLQSSASNSTAN